jgi:hypothetical protein
MAEGLFIFAAVTIAALRAAPSIIWSIRCPPDSPNYKHPPQAPRLWRR